VTDAMTDPVPAETGARPLLEVRSAVKRFGAVVALDGVSLAVAPGEVLALLGDNGAGKSTLIKAISGVHRLDSGSVTLDGVDITGANAMAVRAHGVETVYQDLALFDNLDPAANFFAGRELARPAWLPRGLRVMSHRRMSERTGELLKRLQVTLPDLDAPVALMSGGQRQAVAVARAVAFSSRLVILDEPTAALGLRESARVLDLVRRLKDDGVAVILISHSMDHVMAVADRALVIRRGKAVGEAVPTAENHERLVAWIVGAADGKTV
jgi:ABC-type sugar transport system ATPase subunit